MRYIIYLQFQLLEWPQFQDIIKIKTIGSTYMAASGLNLTKYIKVATQRSRLNSAIQM